MKELKSSFVRKCSGREFHSVDAETVKTVGPHQSLFGAETVDMRKRFPERRRHVGVCQETN